jgi:D-amino peptidase
LNGKLIGETAQFALLAGCYGIPVIFLSGDEAACREAEALLPGIPPAAVKKGLGRTSAVSLGAQRARRMIREGTARALEGHRTAPLQPLRWPGPYVLEKRYFSTDLTGVPLRGALRPVHRDRGPAHRRIGKPGLADIIYA